MKTYTINCSTFIIPNSACMIDDLISARVRDLYHEICRLNGIGEPSELGKEKLVEMWFHNENSDNIECHGYFFEDEYCLFPGSFPRYLPARLFADKKEGDVIKVKIPCCVVSQESTPLESKEEAMIIATITLQQLGYRYERFGTFEEVLKYLGV